MKKREYIILFIALFIPILNVSAAQKANTIAELRAELNSYIAKRNNAQQQQSLTQSQIQNNKNAIATKQSEIEASNKKIDEATEQIDALGKEIADKEEKIREIMRSDAIDKGDNAYLEYVFGAKDISDFIIRYSISEKITLYNKNLITEFENKIKENEQLKVDLSNRKIELDKQITSLEGSISSLGSQLNTLVKEALDFDKEVKAVQELIDYYKKQGCKENDRFETCVGIRSDTGFLRPLAFGMRTSNFGYRVNPATGALYDYHSGVDIGGNREGTAVYSTAAGRVSMVIRRSNCGGNMVYIHHNINGVRYTSTYMHLLTINVNVGDVVTNQTVIGTVGGTSTSTQYGGYDRCTTGAHLHFSLATGWYGVDYLYYSNWVAHLVDSGLKKYANIPPYGVYFFSRGW